MRVSSALLGGLPTSRLFQNVREKQGLCYYCVSAWASLTSVLCLDSGVAHENALRARDAILHEWRALCEEPVPAEELADAKRALLNQLAAVSDTPQGLENWYFSEMLHGSDASPQDVMREVEAVTAADVQNLLARFSPAVCYTLTKEADAHA